LDYFHKDGNNPIFHFTFAFMKRAILHMDLDTFFVSCERLLDSDLVGKPILVGGSGNRGVVSAASYEARTFGARSGIPMKMARLLCPEAIVIQGNSDIYTQYSKMVTEILKESVPVLEKSSIDEFYADLSGMDRFFGTYKYASELRKKITTETGLPISFGLSENKTVSKIAANEAKPDNQIQIEYGFEKAFLAPLSLKKIPMIGDKTFQRCLSIGLHKVSDIQKMSMEAMKQIFGKNGSKMWLRAHGIDNNPIIEYHERKSISKERTFEKDTSDIEKLKATITAMVENLAYQLRKGGKICSCVSVKIRYSNFDTYSKQMKIPYTAADHILLQKTWELFQKLYDKRPLIRLVGVRFSGITNGNYQISLFDNPAKAIDLYTAMDEIRNRYGHQAIKRASAMGARSIGRMSNPFNGDPPILLTH
jgi:DNA polymerase-4